MTIETLFEKMSDPSQKRVLYGIYWAINKMKDIGTKSTCFDNRHRHTFSQWISYKTAEFIIAKLDGFTAGYNSFEATCIINGDRVAVRYITGMANGNVRIDIDVYDIKKEKEEAEGKERIEKENKEIIEKMCLHMYDFFKQNPKATTKDYINEVIKKMDEKSAKVFLEFIKYTSIK
jgi:hypothetical protein